MALSQKDTKNLSNCITDQKRIFKNNSSYDLSSFLPRGVIFELGNLKENSSFVQLTIKMKEN